MPPGLPIMHRAVYKMAVTVERSITRRVLFGFHLILCTIGISLALYAYYVETSKESNHEFKAMCDISDSISCSKVFTSRLESVQLAT